ncbi:MAG: DUF1800 domain-containing protein [Dehalococcoidia bacterium]
MEHTEQARTARPFSRRALFVALGGLAAGGAATAAGTYALTARDDAPPDAAPAPGQTGNAGGNAPPPTPTSDATASGILADNRRWAAHLLRRAAFGGTRAEIDEFASLSREEAVSRLVDYDAIDNTALEQRLAAARYRIDSAATVRRDGVPWWLARMTYTARPLEERLTFLWHGMLTTQVSQIGGVRAHWMVVQNETYRARAGGSYDDLLHAAAKDPAMLVYLNTAESTKEHPNENFARELMELFSMGAGNYSEDDVREAARAFTGWGLTIPRNQLRGLDEDARREFLSTYVPSFELYPRRHDFGTKTFLGETGPFDGTDIIDIILRQPATAEFVCRRLFREFVHPAPADDDLAPLVETWERSGHNIREVLRALFLSEAFASDAAYRAIVRGPVQLVVGLARQLEADTDFRVPSLREGLPATGQVPFEPPNVGGWPGGPAWLSSGTLFARANLVDALLFGQRAIGAPALERLTSPSEIVETAVQLMLDGNVEPAVLDLLHAYASQEAGRPLREVARGIAYLVAMSPQYQLL